MALQMKIFVLACVFLGGLGQGVVNPKLPEILDDHARLALDSGLSASLMYLGIFAASFLYGRLADRGHTFRLLAGGLALYAVVLALFVGARSREAVFALRFFEGLGLSAIYVSADVVLCRASGHDERGRWLSYYGVALSVGLLLGPALVMLAEAAGVARALSPVLLGLAAVVAAAALASFVFPAPPETEARALENPSDGATLAASLYGFLESGIVAVLAALVVSQSQAKVETVFVAMLLSAAPASLGWGWLIDRVGGRRALRWVFVAFAACTGAQLLAHSFLPDSSWQVFTLAMGFGMAAGGIYPAGFAWLIEGSHPSQYGYASGLFTRAYGFGSLLGPLAFGLAVERGGTLGFLGLSALVALAGISSARNFSMPRRWS